TLPLKKPFIMSCIAGAIGGGIIGFASAKVYIMGGLGIFGLPNFFQPGAGITSAFWWVVIAIVISFILGFILTYVAGFKDPVTTIFPTGHAIGITTNDGAEVLIHIGMDTVQLEGKFFTAHVKQGDVIEKGQLLTEFDIEGIKAAGYDVTTPVVVTNSNQYLDVMITAAKEAKLEERFITLVI
ncbi:PTS glucose transporter subunit IIA, partial [Listeria seeligeri]|uniref:PTS sugar transporter subunit IIA n=1 Tax=Listeria seeligeri TaxID=1640 RepID=UPI001887E9D1